MYTEIRFTLNGEQKLYQGDPLRRLLDVLREDYGLTGSKEGCGEVVAVITTDAEGVAVTPVLTWGIYEIRETTVPDGYLDSGCVVTVSIPGNAD